MITLNKRRVYVLASSFSDDELLTMQCFVTQIMEMTVANIGLSAKHSFRCLNTAQSIGRSAVSCVLFSIDSISIDVAN